MNHENQTIPNPYPFYIQNEIDQITYDDWEYVNRIWNAEEDEE